MTTYLRRLAAPLLALVCAFTLAACGGTAVAHKGAGEKATPITVKHAQGELTLDTIPAKVVVFDLGTLDTLVALGLGDRVVGLPKTNLPAFLSAFADAKYTDVGTLFEPNYEAINQLKPDLVIIGGRSAKTYPEMSKHFPTIDAGFDSTKPFVEGVAEAATLMGKVFRTEKAVEDKVAALKTKAEGLTGKASGQGNAMILMTSAGKVTLHGPASRFGLVHSMLGFGEAVTDVKADSHGMPVSFELIAEKNPDVIYVVDRDAAVGAKGENATAILDTPLVNGTKAAKDKRLVLLDSQRWYIVMHGLANANAMLDEATKGLKA